MKRLILILILFIAFLPFSKGQTIFPPKLECVTNTLVNGGDILLNYTIPPTNACGTFSYYLVYGSMGNPGGAYAIVDTIFNQAQTVDTIIDAKGLSTTWSFYLVSIYANCPGAITLNSDTVNNQDPIPPVINYITVTGPHAVAINWQPSVSPQTYGYIIYKISGNQNNPIDTVYGKNTTNFTDTSSSPSTDTVSYVIATIDSCNHTGPISVVPHTTVFLSGVVANCQPTGTVTWTPYRGWPIIDHYTVYISLNGVAPTVVTATQALTAQFNYTSDKSICLTVVAYKPANTDSSVSNIVCFNGNSSNAITNFYIRDVTVAGPQVNKVTYSMKPNSSLFLLQVQRAADQADLAPIGSVTLPSSLAVSNNYYDSAAVNDAQSYYYSFIATDSCGKLDTSTVGKSILLSGFAFTTLKNSISWDSGYLQYGTVLEYRVYRKPNLTVPITVVTASTFSYEEDVTSLVGDTGNLCYVVEAKIAMSFPNGLLDTVYSRSNILCLDQIIQVTVPNAFVPGGVNKIFKPVLRFTGDKSYSFQVYNRWGGLLFSTKNFSEGWDGTYDGKVVEQGVYAYDIQIIDQSGRNTEKKGTVMVMR